MDNEGSSIIIPTEAHPRRIRVGAGGSLTIPRVRQACETILCRLDVRAEAEALGVEFAAASPGPRGWLPCRAVGRVARNPWAAINVGSDGRRGLSRDLGDTEGRATSFFDLAVTIGRFPDRERAVRHYAERTGVGIPPAGHGGPHGARFLADRVAWIPARPSAPADLDAWCRRKSIKKHARGFFLARCGEVLGIRKELQVKDLQKQKRCGLLECSCEDLWKFVAGGGKLSTAEIRGERPKALPGLSIRGSVAWIRWIDRARAKEHRSRSGLVEVALVAWARAQGLQDPPARQESVEAARFA